MHEGIISVERWVAALTSGPARLLNLPHGRLRKGDIADVTLLAPQEKWTFGEDCIASKSRNSPYIGHEFRGRIRATIVGGRVAYRFAKKGGK